MNYFFDCDLNLVEIVDFEFGKKVDNVGMQINDHIQARVFAKNDLLERLEHEFRVTMANAKK